MKVWIVVHEDRHAEPEVSAYSAKEAAIEAARKTAHEFDRFEEYQEHSLNEGMQKSGWVFYATYSCESDSVRVVEREVIAQ